MQNCFTNLILIITYNDVERYLELVLFTISTFDLITAEKEVNWLDDRYFCYGFEEVGKKVVPELIPPSSISVWKDKNFSDMRRNPVRNDNVNRII
jgi:hypothetical protein